MTKFKIVRRTKEKQMKKIHFAQKKNLKIRTRITEA
jgi:hypothetical protein